MPNFFQGVLRDELTLYKFNWPLHFCLEVLDFPMLLLNVL